MQEKTLVVSVVLCLCASYVLKAESICEICTTQPLMAYAGAVPGQKHKGEGFMESFGSSMRSAPRVQQENIQKGDIISTDKGDYRATKTITLSLPNIRFAFDSYDIASMFETQIQNFADELLRSGVGARVLVEGHTDGIGTDAYNYVLSRNRANAVKDKLIEFGIQRTRIDVRAYGKTRPVASNTTAQGRARNRRVEMILIEPIR